MAALASGQGSSSTIDQAEKKSFMNFAVMNNKNYVSVEEMKDRLEIYHQSHLEVEELNRTNTGVSFELNYTADWTEDEYEDHMGMKAKLAQQS